MKNSLLTTLIVIGAVFGVTACGSGSSIDGIVEDAVSSVVDEVQIPDFADEVQDALDEPKSVLTQEVKDSITYMYSEESLAYDVYTNIYKIQAVDELDNISTRSESAHIEAVNELAIKYDLNMTQYPDTDVPYSIEGIGDGHYPVEHIQELYDLLYDKGIQSEQDALEVGCMVEVVDIVDLTEFIAEAEEANASDVVTIFTALRNGSYSHYWAFDQGLKDMGVNDGCCAVDSVLGFDFCQPDYPRK